MGSRPSAPINAKPPTWDEIESKSDSAYFSQYTGGAGAGGAAESKDEDAAGGGAPRGKHWVSDRAAEAEIRYAARGKASKETSPATTLTAAFKLAAERKPNTPALRREDVPRTLARGARPPEALPREEWDTLTMKQYYDQTKQAAQAFINLGLQPHDAVSIYGFNAPEWFMAEMGAILAGGIAAGVYPSDTKDQLRFKCKHSGASIAAIENQGKLKLFREIAGDLPALKAIIVWAPEEGDDMSDIEVDGRTIKVHKWSELAEIAAGGDGDKVEDRMAAQKPGHCCAYIYTSGTTGEPKAVMISHDNIVYESRNAVDFIEGLGTDPEGDRLISYLPLSHVAGMMVDIVCMISIAAFMEGHVCCYFARPYDLKAGTIGDRLRGVEPTAFLGVPRVWEKIQEKMMATVAANPLTGAKLKVARWSKKRGLEHALASQMGGNGSYGCCYNFADKKVLSVVKSRLGLTHCKFAFTGAAPIKTETLEYYGALGLQINEVYGMSECTGAVTWSTDSAHKWGSCGWALPGCEVRVLNSESGKEVPRWNSKSGKAPTEAEQGEVCYRGRNIMMGYMANPDLGEDHLATIKGKNESAIDENGWLHSGDKGTMDEDGCIRITGRYKELIIGAGGENIAPVPIEDAVKARCPAISNIVMIGDKRKFNIALVTLKAVGATGELPGTDNLEGPAATLVSGVSTISAAMKSEAYIAAVQKAIVDTNADPKAVPSNAAKIQKFSILPHDLSITGEELGPTLKLKRGVVEKKFLAVIDSMYTADNAKKAYIPFGDATEAAAAASS